MSFRIIYFSGNTYQDRAALKKKNLTAARWTLPNNFLIGSFYRNPIEIGVAHLEHSGNIISCPMSIETISNGTIRA